MGSDILTLVALGGTFLLTVILGRIILPVLRAKKVGQIIREEGPTSHYGKAGTPTMGGICFIMAMLAVLAGTLIYRFVEGGDFAFIPLALVILLGFGNAVIGFIDDYCKLLKKQNEGLTSKQKFFLQVVVAAAFVALMAITGNLETAFRIPFTSFEIELGWVAYAIYLLVIVGFVNSTNLTDGLDGLASSVSAVVAGFMLVFAYTVKSEELSLVAAALLGGVLGFLVYNHHPAKMFMGDTGSLFLGGIIIGCGVMAGELLLFVMAGLMFVIEMLSSLLQVLYFKATHGKRIFKMAPLHHHFEKCGWREVPIVLLFAGVTVIFCIVAYLGI